MITENEKDKDMDSEEISDKKAETRASFADAATPAIWLVYEAIADSISKNQTVTSTSLAADTGVDRNNIGSAIRTLRNQGLVDHVPGDYTTMRILKPWPEEGVTPGVHTSSDSESKSSRSNTPSHENKALLKSERISRAVRRAHARGIGRKRGESADKLRRIIQGLIEQGKPIPKAETLGEMIGIGRRSATTAISTLVRAGVIKMVPRNYDTIKILKPVKLEGKQINRLYVKGKLQGAGSKKYKWAKRRTNRSRLRAEKQDNLVYAQIRKYFAEKNRPPSLAEIVAGTGIKKTQASYSVQRLIDAGLLIKEGKYFKDGLKLADTTLEKKVSNEVALKREAIAKPVRQIAFHSKPTELTADSGFDLVIESLEEKKANLMAQKNKIDEAIDILDDTIAKLIKNASK